MLRIVLLIGSLAAGGVAAWMVYSWRGEPTVTTVVEPATPVPVQDVLVASADLGPRHALTKEDMRWQSWPESMLNPVYIIRSARPGAVETLTGSFVRSRMTSGEPIRDENLAPLNAALSATLPSGKRAVAVKISPETFGGGLIQQNDRVDVILSVKPPATQTETKTATQTETTTVTSLAEHDVYSRTIVRDVPVLAIDLATEATVDERSKDATGKAKFFDGRTATLLVDASAVETLATGELGGKLSLSLRSPADNGKAPPLPPLPQATLPPCLKKFQLWTHNIGSIEVIDIVKSPACAPEQVMPGEPPQAQQNSSGVALR